MNDELTLKYLREDVIPLMKYPLEDITDDLLEEDLDYDIQSILIQNFINSLVVYTHTDLGTSDSDITVTFSSNVYTHYFILEVGITPDYLLCYTFNGDKIDLTVPLTNYTP